MLEILAAWTSDHDGVPGAAGDRAADAPQARDDALCAEAPRLRRLVHRLLGWRASAADLDDVVQDVLLAAFRHRERFRGDSSLRTWLTTIALRKAQRHANANRRRRRLRSLFGIAEPAVPDRQTDDERLDRTRAAMQQLAHGDREVLVLRYLEQRDVEEIASLCGCSRTAVDARLSRARQRLRDRLTGADA
ncbi:MAG: RNA polymerase sigma factor [Planctomycetota bacterium]